MTFPTETMRIRPTKGQAPDIPPWELSEEFYSLAFNVLFRDGFPSREFGHAEVYATPLAQPSFLQSVVDGSRNFWVYAGDSTVHVAEGATHSDISFAGQGGVSFDNAWTGGLLNGLVFLNNGLNTPVGWDNDPSNVMTELPGWPSGTIVQAMRAHKFYLFGLDVTDAGGQFHNRVMWSDSADPGTFPGSWTPAIDNDAGFVDLAEAEAPVLDGGSLRDVFMIYKSQSVWAADFVGGNSIFTFRQLFSSSGILNRNCWVEYESNHVFMSDSDILLTDGHSVRSIADKRVRQLIVDNVDANNIANSFLAHNRAKNEIWVCFPEVNATECTAAAVWDYRSDTWGLRAVPNILHAASGIISDVAPDNTWDAQNVVPDDIWDNRLEIWNTQGFSFREDALVMAAYADTKLQEVDAADDFDGLPVSAKLDLDKRDLGTPDRQKLIKRVYPRFKAAPGTAINIRIGASDTVDGADSFTPTKLYTVGTDRYLDFTHQGRYISFEFTSIGSVPWTMTGFDVEFRLTSWF